MRQSWHDLLFAHWPVAAEALRPLVPPALPLDTFDGSAWLSIIPFHMSGIAARLLPPLPGLSAFPELNVRTYVTLDGKPGVYFFSLDAANLAAVWTARRLFHLPYFHAEMNSENDGESIWYSSRRIHRGAPEAGFRARYAPTSSPPAPKAGSIEYFLTERYCLYTLDGRGGVHRCEIHHAPWLLQRAEAEIEKNTMHLPHGIKLPDEPPLLYFARLQEVRIWAPTRLPLASGGIR